MIKIILPRCERFIRQNFSVYRHRLVRLDRLKLQGMALVLLSLTLITGAGCESTTPQIRPGVTALTAPTTIPFFTSGGVPVVDVLINDQGPYAMMLDTGSSMLLVGSNMTDRLALPKGSVQYSDVILSAGGVDSVRYKWIDSMRIGQAEFKGMDCISSTQSIFNQSIHRPSGLLGFKLFSDVLLVINYQAQTLTIKDDYLCAAAPDSIPMSFTIDGDIAIDGILDGRTQKFIIDTGSTAGLFLRGSSARDVQYLKRPKPIGPLLTPTGESVLNRGQLAGTIELAGHRIEQPIAYTSSELTIFSSGAYDERPLFKESLPIIGNDFLQHFEVTIDQRRHQLRLRRLHANSIQLK